MCSDRNKRRGWRRGEGRIEESRGGGGGGGEEEGGEGRAKREAKNSPDKQLQDRKNQEEGRRLRATRSILISCFDFHKMSIILNHPGPPLLASYA